MPFPLGDWIDEHADVPHNLGSSGFRGQLRSRTLALKFQPEPDPGALRDELGRLLGVPGSAVFLTHGASEGNFLALSFLAGSARRVRRTPTLRIRTPEYPPLSDAAWWLGYRRSRPSDRAVDVCIRSDPNNPEGGFFAPPEIRDLEVGSRSVIIDETFRELSGRPSKARQRRPRVWVTGSFTKIYGADDDRVGFVVPPESSRDAFAKFHGLALDELPPASVTAVRALLAHRAEILTEGRGILRANRHALAEAFPHAEVPEAPVWFDRGGGPGWGDRMAQSALRHGVLVCPGSFFGDSRGVRISLTRRSFPEDLRAYLQARQSMGSDSKRR